MRNYESIGCFVLILFFLTEEKVPECIFGNIYSKVRIWGEIQEYLSGHAIVFLRHEGNPDKDQGMACMMNVQRLEYKTLQGRQFKNFTAPAPAFAIA